MKDPALYELLQMIPVQAGTYEFGLEPDDKNLIIGRAHVQYQASVDPFELGRFPVTNLLWSLVMNEPLQGGPLHPKVNVNWYEAVEFCSKLNELLGLPQAMVKDQKGWRIVKGSSGFRLQAEHEWEWVARSGGTDPQYGTLDEIAWHRDNSKGEPQPVGLKLPTQWGFHDILGNVWEWCWDRLNRNWNTNERKFDDQPDDEDPLVESDWNRFRAQRGGSYWDSSIWVHAIYRNGAEAPESSSVLGFRLARSLPPEDLISVDDLS